MDELYLYEETDDDSSEDELDLSNPRDVSEYLFELLETTHYHLKRYIEDRALPIGEQLTTLDLRKFLDQIL
jgi:hypothetical protein